MADFFNHLWDWLNNGVVDLFTAVIAYLIEKLFLFALDFILWAVPFAWGIAKQIMTDLSISERLNAAFEVLPSDLLSTIFFFRVPEALNLIISAFITRFVLRFIPGL